LTPQPGATVANPSGPNLAFTYLDSVLLYGPDGTPVTGLDASPSGDVFKYPGFPDLPVADFVGDGFGNAGPGGRAIAIDSEGLVINPDGSFWISDEYGPYVYKFGPTGVMTEAIRPPDAYIPIRNGVENFSADSPPAYDPSLVPTPANNPIGRQNNQGMEGLTVSPDYKSLFGLMQSALNQEGGLAGKATNENARLIKYWVDPNTPGAPYAAKEYVVPLPQYPNKKTVKTAAQSDIFYLNNNQFFVLSRDSGSGHGQGPSNTASVYRHLDIFDISAATDIHGPTFDSTGAAIADANGVLNNTITPVQYCPFIDYNNNAQLNRFGVHNGGADDQFLLNEKWESIALLPVDGVNGDDDQWFVFSLSDNDFITQNGHLKNGTITYKDGSGYNLDNQALVFHITLPAHSHVYNRGT
jgi:hypothetical protein